MLLFITLAQLQAVQNVLPTADAYRASGSLQITWKRVHNMTECTIAATDGSTLAITKKLGVIDDGDADDGRLMVPGYVICGLLQDIGPADPTRFALMRLPTSGECSVSMERISCHFNSEDADEIDYERRIETAITPWRAESFNLHCWVDQNKAATAIDWVRAFDPCAGVVLPMRIPQTDTWIVHGPQSLVVFQGLNGAVCPAVDIVRMFLA